MRYKCNECGKVIESNSFYVQNGVIIEHERTHKETKE